MIYAYTFVGVSLRKLGGGLVTSDRPVVKWIGQVFKRTSKKSQEMVIGWAEEEKEDGNGRTNATSDQWLFVFRDSGPDYNLTESNFLRAKKGDPRMNWNKTWNQIRLKVISSLPLLLLYLLMMASRGREEIPGPGCLGKYNKNIKWG